MHNVRTQELAWSSFVLLKNTNACSVAVLSGPHALMARGALGSGVTRAGDAVATLDAIRKVGGCLFPSLSLRMKPDQCKLHASLCF